MAKDYKVLSRERTHVDRVTGAVTTETTEKLVVKQVESSGNFFFTFIDFMAPLMNIKQGKDRHVLDEICQMAEINTGLVRLVKEDRAAMCDRLDMKASNLSRSIKNLLDAGVIEGSSSYFFIKPELFWKGSAQKRFEVMQKRSATVTVALVSSEAAGEKAIREFEERMDKKDAEREGKNTNQLNP